jgi:anti-anti-sigma regulatory factor
MRLRIDVDRSATGHVITVHGELLAAGVEELERVSNTKKMPLTLELSQLQAADQAGIAALLAARNRGARLTGMSPYIALLLEGAAADVRTRARRDPAAARHVDELGQKRRGRPRRR